MRGDAACTYHKRHKAVSHKTREPTHSYSRTMNSTPKHRRKNAVLCRVGTASDLCLAVAYACRNGIRRRIGDVAGARSVYGATHIHHTTQKVKYDHQQPSALLWRAKGESALSFPKPLPLTKAAGLDRCCVEDRQARGRLVARVTPW